MVNDLMRPILIDFDHQKVRRSRLSKCLVEGKIFIRKERERNLICLFKDIDFIGGVPCTDSD